MLKLHLSNESYYELEHILNTHSKEYNCIRLSYVKGCCKSSRVDIYLDNLDDRKEYIVKYTNNIPFIYNEELTNNISIIEIIYKNSSFMIKITPNKTCRNCAYRCNSNCSSSTH